MIPKIVSAAIKSGIAAQDIQILAPMYRGQAGINNLNTIMQDLLNPKEKANQFAFNDIFFRKNDKILHLVNDTELNVFNGDIGIITDLIPGKYTESKQDEIYMSFDGNEVIYPRNEWNKITLAYAMSIHKSQGSEFPVVILPITRQSGRMLQRNLIYTAITRAKSKLVMLGEIAAFDYAVHNEGPNVIPTSSNVLNKLIHKLLISLSKRMLKTREQTHPIKQKGKIVAPQKPLKTKTS